MFLSRPRPRRRPRPGVTPAPPPGFAPVDHGGATAVGARTDNQDRWAAGPRWGVVCDGVGGHAGGAEAAQLALDATLAALVRAGHGPGPAGGPPEAGPDLRAVVAGAHRAVLAGQAADDRLAHMASTLTLAVTGGVGPTATRWHLAHVGDSPAWVVDPDGARPVTVAHNLAGDLLRSGALSPEEARSHPGRRILTRAVGGVDEAEPEGTHVDLAPGDALVLASDGVSDVLDEADLHDLVAAARSADDAARALVDEAVRRGVDDNTTAVVLRHPTTGIGDRQQRRARGGGRDR